MSNHGSGKPHSVEHPYVRNVTTLLLMLMLMPMLMLMLMLMPMPSARVIGL